jgi:hypothetical protein
MTEVVEPSKLGVQMITQDFGAREPLAGKAYDKAIAKAAPSAIRYLAQGAGASDVERIVELALMARTMEEAGEVGAAQALIDLATLVYRASWTAAKSDPATLNEEIEAFVAASEYPVNDPALVPWSDGNTGLPGFYDLCLNRDGTWSNIDPVEPSGCASKGGGLPVRAGEAPPWVYDTHDMPNLEQRLTSGNGIADLTWGIEPDLGGLGIHKVIQDATADDKLAGKKYKKALSRAIKNQGPAIAKALAGGMGAGAEKGVVELVLLARAADEAGDKKAAAAFVDLALAAFRSSVRTPEMTGIPIAAIDRLVKSDYPGVPGLQVLAPEGMTDACFTGGRCTEAGLESQVPWTCVQRGGRPQRLSIEEAKAAGCECPDCPGWSA